LDWEKDALMGNVLIGASFALIFIGITGFASQLNILDISTINSIATLFVLVIVASFFEEAFYSGVLAPTLAEKTGIASSILITGLLFTLGHGFAYGWALIPLIIAFAFREVATTIVLYRKSWINVFVCTCNYKYAKCIYICNFYGVKIGKTFKDDIHTIAWYFTVSSITSIDRRCFMDER